MASDWAMWAATLALQCTVVMGVGLAAERGARRWGPALQSSILRSVVVLVLAGPAALVLTQVHGLDRFHWSLAGRREGRAGMVRAPQGRPVGEAGTGLSGGERVRAVADVGARPALSDAVGSSGKGGAIGWFELVVGVWVAGTSFCGVRMGVAWCRLRGLRRRGEAAEAAVLAAARRLAGKLGVRMPRVVVSDEVATPCLVGYLHPAIVLPADGGFPSELVLVHELAHLQRRDCLWFLLARMVAAVWWFQPLALVLVGRLELTADAVCDEMVVEQGHVPAAYAEVLVSLAERRGAAPLLAAGAVSRRSSLARRVEALLKGRRVGAMRPAMRWGVVAAALGVMLASLVPTFAAPAPSTATLPAAKASSGAPLVFQGIVVNFLTGKGIPQAQVTVHRLHRPPGGEEHALVMLAPSDHIVTDDAGRYTVTVPAEQAADETMQLATEASAPHYAKSLWDGWGVGLIQRKVKEGDATFGLRVQLYPADEVTGVIKDWQGHPLAHVPVAVWSHSSKAATSKLGYDSSREETQTDAEGRYRGWVMQDADMATVSASPKEWANILLNIGKNHGDLGTTVAERGVTLKGRLVDGEGKPVAGVMVYASFLARGNGMEDEARSAVTDEGGDFELGPLSPEAYKVDVAGGRSDGEGGFIETPLPGFYSSVMLTNVVDLMKPLVIRPSPSVHVRLHLVDAQGKRVETFGSVWAMGRPPGGMAQSFTSLRRLRGEAGLVDLLAPEGMTDVTIALDESGDAKHVARYQLKPGGAVESPRELKLARLDRDVDVTLVLYAAPLLTVHVHAPAGIKERDIRVVVRYDDPSISSNEMQGWTNWNYASTPGTWRFPRLLPEEGVTLVVSAPGCGRVEEKLRLKEGEKREVEVTLERGAKQGGPEGSR